MGRICRIPRFAAAAAMLCCVLLLSASTASSVSSQQTDLIYWEEELPEPPRMSIDKKEPSRRLFWHGRMHEEHDANLKHGEKKHTPHPMRTNEWQLFLHISKKEAENLGINTTMLLEFSDNGFCRHAASPMIGKWKLHPSGITWQIPLPNSVILQCHADLILNPFGKRPRMVRGTIVKDDGRKWFRPVVATFSGEGIGHDTADVSYKERGFGL